MNFPDPTITGVDDESTRFVQIHFLASMRLTLVLLKYLDLVDAVPVPDPETYDTTVDTLIAEVQSIMSGWNAVCLFLQTGSTICTIAEYYSNILKEELLSTTTNDIDSSFCVDILFSSYKMLILFDQSKNSNQRTDHLPRQTVDIARKSLQMFQVVLGSRLYAHWGVRLVFHNIRSSIACLVLICDLVLFCFTNLSRYSSFVLILSNAPNGMVSMVISRWWLGLAILFTGLLRIELSSGLLWLL